MHLVSDRKLHPLKCHDNDTALRYKTLPEAAVTPNSAQLLDSVMAVRPLVHVYDKRRSQSWMFHESVICQSLQLMRMLMSHVNDQIAQPANDSVLLHHPSDLDQIANKTHPS